MMKKPPPSRIDLQRLLGERPPATPERVVIAPEKTQRIVFQTQPGINVPAFVLRPEAPAGVLVACDDRGKEALATDPLVLAALEKNWMVWAIDPRGIGESKTQNDGWVFAVSLLLGENFVWRQGSDIARVIEQAARLHPTNVGLYARGHNASLAATYALAIGPQPKWAALAEGFLSFQQFVDRAHSMEASYRLQNDDIREQRRTAFDREIPHEYFVYRAWGSLDLPQLLARSKAKITVVDPIDGDWKPMTANDARAMLPRNIKLAKIADVAAERW
jgi:pimeloyl-ACP methyl ester carboxylesterase